jgi:DNA-binding response OmpR family regulator
MRVLLIDDNPDDRVLIRRELTRHFPDFDVEEIRAELDLRQALAAPVDLVITDFELRWTNGIEVLQRVKQRFPECPVVMFTSTGTQEIAVAAMKAGLDDYVIKSAAHYVRLPAAVEAALARAAARARARRRQRRFDDMLSALGVGVFRADADGRLREANDALLTFLGGASLDDARALDLAPLLEAAQAAGAAGTVRVTRVGGGEIELRVSGGMIEEADGAWAIEGVARRVREP